MITDIKTVDTSIEKVSIANDNAAFLEYGSNSQSLLVRGFNIEDADKIYNFIDRLKEGTSKERK